MFNQILRKIDKIITFSIYYKTMNYERRFNEQLIINLSLNEDKQRILLELQNNNEIKNKLITDNNDLRHKNNVLKDELKNIKEKLKYYRSDQLIKDNEELNNVINQLKVRINEIESDKELLLKQNENLKKKNNKIQNKLEMKTLKDQKQTINKSLNKDDNVIVVDEISNKYCMIFFCLLFNVVGFIIGFWFAY